MILEAQDIHFSYKNTSELLCGVDLTLEKGLTVLLGPNGCGKSTLLRILSGELVPRCGTVLLDGTPIRKYPGRERAKHISVMLQNSVPVLDYTVRELVTMGRSAHLPVWGSTAKQDELLTEESMKVFRVDHLAERCCNTLSGGEYQRVMLASAWANDPQILLLDEPTSATDVAHTLLILEKLKEFSCRKCVFMICHDLTLAANIADRIVLMRQGKVLASGRAQDVLTEENLEKVYDSRFLIVPCPGGKKVFLPEAEII